MCIRDRFLIAEGGASPLGCVWLEPLASKLGATDLDPDASVGRKAEVPSSEPAANTWYLGSLSVDPAIQNTGLGRDLLHLAEQWAVARGAQRIRMTVVNHRDTLIAWYQRRGYQLTGELQPFPYDDTRFGTPRRPDLAFVVLEKAVTPIGAPPAHPRPLRQTRTPSP